MQQRQHAHRGPPGHEKQLGSMPASSKMMGAPVAQKRSRSGGNSPTWASKTRDEVSSRPASVKMELLGPLEQQAWREHEDGTAGATGAAGTAAAEEKMKQNGSEGPLEVETSDVQWVVEPPWFPAHRRGAV